MPGKHVPVDRLDDALRQHPTWNAPAGFSRAVVERIGVPSDSTTGARHDRASRWRERMEIAFALGWGCVAGVAGPW